MNLTDIKPTQTALQFANSMQNTFGVKVDIDKLNLDKSQKLLLSVNEQIQKQRLSEDRHRLHTTKSYLAKIFIKENLEKHIAELQDVHESKLTEEADEIVWESLIFSPSNLTEWGRDRFDPTNLPKGPQFRCSTRVAPGKVVLTHPPTIACDTDGNPIPPPESDVRPAPGFYPDIPKPGSRPKPPARAGHRTPGKGADAGQNLWRGQDFKKSADLERGFKGSNKRHGFGEGVNEEKLTEKQSKSGGDEWSFDPKGMTALRMLVGSQQMARAKRAIEMAKRGRAVPATYMTAFIPLIDILDDIMRSGMANVQMLKNLNKRARQSLGIDKLESIDPETQMKNENTEQVSQRLRSLYESQEDQAELLLASKDVVDRVQKAVDDLSKLRNEDLPPLLDAMRDEVGAEISSAYANIAIPTLDQLVSANGMARETLAQASRILTGEEQVPQAMGVEAPAEEVPAEEFETADAAAGEAVEAGRAERV